MCKLSPLFIQRKRMINDEIYLLNIRVFKNRTKHAHTSKYIMSLPIPSRQIILRIIRKRDGKSMCMNIAEDENRKVGFIKSHLKHTFHPYGKFHLYYKGRHIKSRHTLSYYGITGAVRNIQIILD